MKRYLMYDEGNEATFNWKEKQRKHTFTQDTTKLTHYYCFESVTFKNQGMVTNVFQ